jgi:uncharacterized protein
MELETDLEVIRQLSEEREDENWEFRTFLKGYGQDEADARVHRLYEEVSAQIDCTACGNCCVALRIEMNDADVQGMAEGLSMTPEEFREQYIQKDEEGHDGLCGQPCVFLRDRKCTVYAHRPEPCRSYPFLHKEGFVFRLMGVISNCSICPIVFNVYERLKDEIWSRRRRRR